MDFTQIYEQYKEKVFRICLGYTNNTEEAKDILQETFITVWQHLESFRNEANVGTWIYRIATNKCLRSLENTKRRSKLNTATLTDKEFQQEDKQKNNVQMLRKIISALPELDRIIIGLTLEGIKQEDIAQIVGLTHSNIRVKIHRIKQKILNKFTEYGQF